MSCTIYVSARVGAAGTISSIYSQELSWALFGTVSEEKAVLGFDSGTPAAGTLSGTAGSLVYKTITELLSQHQYNSSVGTRIGVTVGDARLLESNNLRKFVGIVNESDTTMYLALGSCATLNEGIRLGTEKGERQFELNWAKLYTGEIWGKHGQSGTKNVVLIEGI